MPLHSQERDGEIDGEDARSDDVECGVIDTRIICSIIKTQRVHEHTGLPILDPIPIVQEETPGELGRPRRRLQPSFNWNSFFEERRRRRSCFVQEEIFLFDEEM